MSGNVGGTHLSSSNKQKTTPKTFNATFRVLLRFLAFSLVAGEGKSSKLGSFVFSVGLSPEVVEDDDELVEDVERFVFRLSRMSKEEKMGI